MVAGGSAPQGEDVEEASQKPGRSSVFFLLEAIINHSNYFPFTHLDTPPQCVQSPEAAETSRPPRQAVLCSLRRRSPSHQRWGVWCARKI